MEGSRAALHVGVIMYEEARPPAMELWNVELASNLLRGTGSFASAISLGLYYPGGALPAARVHDNQLEAGRGLAFWSVGGGLELSRNRIYAEGAEPEKYALALVFQAGANLRIEDNQVELGDRGMCLGFSGCQDVRVARNVCRGVEDYVSLSLIDSHQVEVAENDFRDGRCWVSEGEGLRIRANRMGRGLMVSGAGNGLVAHNHMEGDAEITLSLEEVFGQWQVVGNSVAGGLRVLPRVYSELTAGLDDLALELPGPGGRGPLSPPWLSRSMDVAGGVWEALRGARRAVGELVEASSTLAASPLVEDEVRLLVQGNRAGELVVGHVHPSESGKPGLEGLPVAEPHALSVAQVLGNQVEGRLVVNGYARCIAAHNVAGRLRVGGDVPERVLDSNLSLE
jgi:hypothetical protein